MSNSFTIGQIIDRRYKILDVLGSGGMANVFKAEQFGFGRIVAIKVMYENLIQDRDSYTRFEREATALSTLSHKNIATFYSYGVLESSSFPASEGYGQAAPYIVMEYLEGKSLREVLNKEDLLSWQRALHITKQVCDALEHAHVHQFIHRDIKPSNIVLLDQPEVDFVKVVDFGLAKLGRVDQKLTRTGALIGSVAYMSPEQCEGKSVDSRSDIYALGCVLYEMLCGSVPLVAENPIGLMHKHVTEKPWSLSDRRREVILPQGLEECVFKAMAKIPEQRYQTMREFSGDLELVLGGKGRSSLAVGEGHAGRSQKAEARVGWKQGFITFSFTIFVLFLGLLWLLTDAGIDFAEKTLFRTVPKEEQAIQVFYLANWLEAIGRKKAAEKLRNDLVDRLNGSYANSLAAASTFYKLAKCAYVEGDKDAAGEWSKRAIVATLSLLTDPAYYDGKNRDTLEHILNGSSKIMHFSGMLLPRSIITMIEKNAETINGDLRCMYISAFYKLRCDSIMSFRNYDPDYATLFWIELAAAYAYQGKVAESLDAYNTVRRILDKGLAKNNLLTASFMCQEANLLTMSNENEQALKEGRILLKEGMRIIDRTPSPPSRTLNRALRHASDACRAYNMLEECVKYARRAYDTNVALSGINSRFVEDDLYALGEAELALHPETGIKTVVKNLESYLKANKANDNWSFERRQRCLDQLIEYGRYSEAVQFYGQQMASLREMPIKNPSSHIEFYGCLTLPLVMAGDFQEAGKANEAYWNLVQKYKSGDSILELRGWLNQAALAYYQGYYHESSLCIKKAGKLLQKHTGQVQAYKPELYYYDWLTSAIGNDRVAGKLLELSESELHDFQPFFYRHQFTSAIRQKRFDVAQEYLDLWHHSLSAQERFLSFSSYAALAYAKELFKESEKFTLIEQKKCSKQRFAPFGYFTSINLSATLLAQGKGVEAEKIVRSAADGFRKTYPKSTTGALRFSAALERILLSQKRYADAEKMAKKSIDDYEKAALLPSESSLLTANRMLFVDSLLKQEKFTEAEAQIEKIFSRNLLNQCVNLESSQNSLLTMAFYEKKLGKLDNCRQLLRSLLDNYAMDSDFFDFSLLERAKSLLAECNKS